MARRLRIVRYEETASAAWDRLREQEPRYEEIHRAIEWTLARRPELGRPVGTTGLRVLFTRGAAWGILSLAFFYRFDTDLVAIEDIIRTDDAAD